MYLPIISLLNNNELDQIEKLLAAGDFKSGKLTATGAAREVKNNEQLTIGGDVSNAISSVIGTALSNNILFREGTQAKYFLPFLISRYAPGMEYGWHVDNPVMSDGNATIRVDMSITIFLSTPDEYEGGELEIETEAGLQLFKLNKGDAIVYPTTRLHRVRPVTKGLRQVAVSWIQSLVKDTAQRDLLFQLKSLQQGLEQQQMGSQLHLLSQQIHSNLLRMLTEI